MPNPCFIAVSGIMGAGKTTLARGLASALGWSYVPEAVPATLLLGELFKAPGRWAFETQTAFLVNKAIQLQEALGRSPGIILDRSIYEDADVFGEYFYRKGYIDPRSYTTYRALAEHFFGELPAPDLIIHCRCPLEVTKSRLATRGTGAASLYPPNHVDEIDALYAEWEARYRRSDLYVLDTAAVDTRRPTLLRRIANEVVELVARATETPVQYQLFGEPLSDAQPEVSRLLTAVHHAPDSALPRRLPSARRPVVRVTTYPSAYLAAPFTAFGNEPSEATLFTPPHGALSAEYRTVLLNIERALGRLGVHCFIPHRDINAWGDKLLPPSEVAKLAATHVKETDVFVGLLGLSHGAHLEFGLAYALRKPALIIRSNDLPESFIAAGLDSSLDRVHTIEVSSLAEAGDAINRPETIEFLEQFVPLDTLTRTKRG